MLWLLTDLELEQALGLEREKNKWQEPMEKVQTLLAYAIALWVGERLRDVLLGTTEGAVWGHQAELLTGQVGRRYRGAFVRLNVGRFRGELRMGAPDRLWRLLFPRSRLRSNSGSELQGCICATRVCGVWLQDCISCYVF